MRDRQAPVRVLMLLESPFPTRGGGGAESQVRTLALALRARGHQVSVLTPMLESGPQHVVDTVEGIPVRRLGYHGSNRYPVAPGFLDATAGSDLIHVHAIDFFFDALALARPFRGIPMVASTHGGFFHTSFASKLKSMYFATVTRAARRPRHLLCWCAPAPCQARLWRSQQPSPRAIRGRSTCKWASAASPAPTEGVARPATTRRSTSSP